MKPEEVLVIHVAGQAGKAVNLDALEYATSLPRTKLVAAVKSLTASGHLAMVGCNRITRTIYALTEAGQALAKGPELKPIGGGRQVFSTLLNARVTFCAPSDDHRNVMARPRYETPKLQAPMRAGALDAFRLPSKGMI